LLGCPVSTFIWIPISGASLHRVGGEASRCKAFSAHGAETTTDVGGYSYPIAFFNILNGRARLFYEAERFVPDSVTLKAAHPPLVKMQPMPQNGRRGESKQYIGRLTHFRIRNFAHHNFRGSFSITDFIDVSFAPRRLRMPFLD
jgi:hypothetical protein